MSTYLTTFRVGDYVDIKANASVQQGMPYKYYHGKTGRIFNISRTAVGVEVNKKVRGKILLKRFHIRVEHVKKSRCDEDFKLRVKTNDALSRAARLKGKKAVLPKRQPAGPRPAMILAPPKLELLEPVAYHFVV
ncbi:hypothetical protein MMPV_005383 [Pyropia vietnamensis]